MNRVPIIILLNFFLLGCDIEQTAKPYEFKDEEQLLDAETKSPTPNASSSSDRPRISWDSTESRQDPNKPFEQDEDNVVKGRPLHAFPNIQFPE